MFSHVMVGANDFDASRKFYDAVFATLGVDKSFLDSQGRVFWLAPTGAFGLTKPIDGKSATSANGGTIGFATTGPEQTNAWHAAGLAAGGTDCEDAPGWRDSDGGRLYIGYLRDPAGNKLCAMHRAG